MSSWEDHAPPERLLPDAAWVLDELAQSLREHPEVELVGCVGLTSEGEVLPAQLGPRCAERVRRELMRRGVEGSRLVVLVARDPAAVVRKPDQRRVELQVLRQRGGEVARWTGQSFERVGAPEFPLESRDYPPGCP